MRTKRKHAKKKISFFLTQEARGFASTTQSSRAKKDRKLPKKKTSQQMLKGLI